jgi:anti-sigma factor ChrR (cupin superfamily)
MKPIAKDDRKVLNIHEAEFQPWVQENGEIHPSSTLQHDTSKANGVGFHVYRMEPGSSTTPHRHMGNEYILILCG